MGELEIRDLHVSVDGKQILKGISLKIKQGEIHALMGPNGSGKSTLSFTLMGHPKYKIERGDILFDGESLLSIPIHERARKGLFLAFQYPMEIPGVNLSNFLWNSYVAIKSNGNPNQHISMIDFKDLLEEKMKILKMDQSFTNRYLNEGFSGGEKKRTEILQMAILNPKFAVLDETDSGLDVDALKIVANGIKKLANPSLGILLITHYKRILNYIKPDFVHVLVEGKIVKSGDHTLATELEKKGYEGFGG